MSSGAKSAAAMRARSDVLDRSLIDKTNSGGVPRPLAKDQTIS